MAYSGPDRRRHKLVVTRNTEYHLRDGRCVGVRNATTGEWLDDHKALGEELLGGFEFTTDGSCRITHGEVDAGQQACFANDLMTSAVRQLDRPPREALSHYLPNGGAHA